MVIPLSLLISPAVDLMFFDGEGWNIQVGVLGEVLGKPSVANSLQPHFEAV